MKKNYLEWGKVKARLNDTGFDAAKFKQREIWWCSIGENVGVEEDGKNRLFNRPVLIFRKFSRQLFWGIPLSTTKKRGVFYFPFNFAGGVSVALLSQMRALDVSRLGNGRAAAKIGMISSEVFAEIKQKIHRLMD